MSSISKDVVGMLIQHYHHLKYAKTLQLDLICALIKVYVI